jgi:hypothetical protein
MIDLLSGEAATERALGIADIAAEELVRTEGRPSATAPDEFIFDAEEVIEDEHLTHCIAHLCWRGLAIYYQSGYDVIVQLGDFG